MTYEEFIAKVSERAGMSREQAEVISRAVLETLAERISGGEADDLASLVPEPLRPSLQRSVRKPALSFGLSAFVDRARVRAGDPGWFTLDAVRAVLMTLRDAVGDKEFRDALAQLPQEFEEILRVTA
ncbi:DUF2267 domain-containing protein [Pseudonocardia acidicola]|uniref:DUF2267 domain-containing protein n=1 Tax=Pseudonocardia acidicola TaxID=2724939 RepID=A0ABX1S9A8_9PSEU|nr:DUF2267 domain-containing protein [Pseudonocardia acidicola]NMH97402.1 DUF2267 domain-containing protein [Pseudonocardia acidicola]